MLTRISIALLTFVLAGIVPLHGQNQPASAAAPEPIVTDRPAVTNSSVVVPASSIQVENGFLETSSQGQSIVDGPETLVRFGVTTRTELRFTVPDYYHNLNTAGGSDSGFGDFALGVKEQLGPTPGGFDVSAILFLSFPTGAHTVSSGGYDPGSQVPWSRAVRQMDGGWNVLFVLADAGPYAKSDRRIHLCLGSAIDRTLGCVC
jgi:hypothetical protein